MSSADPATDQAPQSTESADAPDTAAEQSAAGPPIRILHGQASDEEVAALTVLLAALAGDQAPTRSRRQQGWSHRRRTLTPAAVRGAGWGGPM